MDEKNIDYAGFIHLVIDALEAAGVEYMIGGAVAAWAWGEPRATLDLDLVVNIPFESIGKLSTELKKRDMLVPADIILDHLLDDRGDQPLNAIHMYSGYKADMYPIRSGDELRQTAFQRRQLVDLGPEIGDVYLHSPEDLIIYKLWYFSLSRQTKHPRDIGAILKTLGNQLDFTYLQSWINRKGLNSIWEEITRNIE